MKKLNKNQKGFTIIEVLIVLAIAGLIMLIVFLAVPALQRNSRNTQRKNDASALLGAISEHISNNNGALPTASGQFNVVFANSTPKLGYYQTPTQVQYNYSGSARAVTAPTTNATDSIVVGNNSKCQNATTSYGTGATTRSVVAMYTIETSNGTTTQCIES